MSRGESVVRIEKVSKWYGEVLGLSGVTIDVPSGVVGLLGPNGAGKSTLMGIVSGLLAPSAGRVTVFGEDPRSCREVRARIGLCPEADAFLPGMGCLEFVSYLGRLSGLSASASRSRAREAMDRLGLAAFASQDPRTMSKGERQRVKLAQALVHEPRLLLLDEPLSGMDHLVRIEVMDLIRSLGQGGTTILVSSHVLSEVEAMTSEVIVLNAGHVLASGHIGDIRAMLDRFPHRIRIACRTPVPLAKALLDGPGVVGLELGGESIVVQTIAPERFYPFLNAAIAAIKPGVKGFFAEDHDLSSVFQYLVQGSPAMERSFGPHRRPASEGEER